MSSILFSLLLLLLLLHTLGLSLHACDATTVGAVDVHRSIKESSDDEKLNLNPVDDEKESNDDDDDRMASESGSVAVGRVRWRVRQRKKGEAEAGFNLDYLPPKTHPPVHN